VAIDGEIIDVTINGVDVLPLIEAELDRRHPDRVKMRPRDPAGFREAWEILGRLWDQTVARARRDRMSTVTALLGDLTDQSLDANTTPVEGPGWPSPRSYPVRECLLLVVLNEEWQHRQFAERDLTVLESRAAQS
jgi:hypothetical protein